MLTYISSTLTQGSVLGSVGSFSQAANSAIKTLFVILGSKSLR